MASAKSGQEQTEGREPLQGVLATEVFRDRCTPLLPTVLLGEPGPEAHGVWPMFMRPQGNKQNEALIGKQPLPRDKVDLTEVALRWNVWAFGMRRGSFRCIKSNAELQKIVVIYENYILQGT